MRRSTMVFAVPVLSSAMVFAAPFLLLLYSPPLSAADAPQADLLDTTCGQYLEALTIAQPPKGASKKQTALAVSAQDDLVQAMMWVHGYITGRDGSAGMTRPLNRAWMVENVGKLAGICQAAPDTLRLADAATKL